MSSALPIGNSTAGTVPMLNTWILWWNAESLARGLLGYWNAPIFHPLQGSLAFNEPQPAMLSVAPVYFLSRSPILAYNVYLVATLALNGWCTSRLLSRLGCSQVLSVAGGTGLLLHPLVWRDLEAIQLTALWPMVLSLTAALDLFLDEGSKAHPEGKAWDRRLMMPGIRLGVWVSVTGWCCLYWSVFQAMTLGVAIAAVALWRRQRSELVSLSVAFIVFLCLTLPVFIPMREIVRANSFRRSPTTVQTLSAQPEDWLATEGHTLWDYAASESTFSLSPGLGRIALLVVGFAVFVVASRTPVKSDGRRTTALILVSGMLFLSALLSFGANLQLSGWRPWESLGAHIGVIGAIRSPFRFAYLTQLAAILLAALAADTCFKRLGKHPAIENHFGRRLVFNAGVLFVAATVAFESIPRRSRLCFPPSHSHSEPWREFIATNTNEDDAILCLPVTQNGSEAAQERAARWMMHSTVHRASLLNGYSGFIPKEWREVRSQLRDGNFSDSLLTQLAQTGTKFIVIRLEQMPPGHVERLETLALEIAYEDSRYRILQIPSKRNE